MFRKIVFSNHALLKLDERNIAKAMVLATVRHPDFSRSSYYGRKEKYKHLGKVWLKVVVIEESRKLVVITAHWVVKLKRS
jgi:hypothetical protein